MSEATVQVGKTLVYSSDSPVESVQEDLVQLRELDKEQEKKQSFWAKIGFAGGVVLVGGFIGGVMTEFENATLFGSLIVLGAIGLVTGIVLNRINARTNLEDRRYELLARLLTLLGKDIAKDSSIQVDLDLRSPSSKHKFSRRGKIGPWKVKFYEDGWLKLRGRFMDGTSFDLVVTELTQLRSRWKTNARGKSKHKSKTKSATVALLRLRPKVGKYPKLSQLGQDSLGAVQVPGWSEAKNLNCTDGSLQLKVGTKQDWSVASEGKQIERDGVQLLALMFLSLYQILNLSRTVHKLNREGS